MMIGRVLALSLAAAACSSPVAPVIPPDLKPPDPAAGECPPARQFAQSWFMIADLDRGVICPDFIEQDECIVALFRDCTDSVKPQRSWQGHIDQTEKIELFRTNETTSGGVPLRSPTRCEGLLEIAEELDAPIPFWAKLRCEVPGGQRHGGLYFERIPQQGEPPVLPFGTLDTSKQVSVFPNPPDPHDIADFEVLSTRRELWAVVRVADLSGLYRGTVDAALLQRVTAPRAYPEASHLTFTADQGHAFLSERTTVHRIDVATFASTSVDEVQDITAMEMTPAGLVVAVMLPDGFELRLRDPVTLNLVRPAVQVNGELKYLAGVYGEASAIAVLVFDESTQFAFVDENLTVTLSPDVADELAHPVVMTDRRKIGFAVDNEPAYFAWDFALNNFTPQMRLPGNIIHAMHYDAEAGIMLLSLDEGDLVAWDAVADRPLLQARFRAEGRVTAIRGNTAGQIYLLNGTDGVIDPLVVSD